MILNSDPGVANSLGAALAAFRDHVIIEAERRRASRAPDEPAVAGRGPSTAFPTALLRRVLALAESVGEEGEAVPPQALADDICALLDSAPTAATPLARAEGASERRAQTALGRAKVVRSLFRSNDLAVADGAIAGFTETYGITIPPVMAAMFRRHATAVLGEVETENARRERGIYPAAGLDPCLSLPLQPAPLVKRWTLRPAEPPVASVPDSAVVAETTPVPEHGTDAFGEGLEAQGSGSTGDTAPPADRVEHPASCRLISTLATAQIECLKASKTKKRTKKVLADYVVARDLLIELMGDLPIGDLTKKACEQFKELLSTLPAMHGKAERFRNLTAQESIRLADADDEVEDLKVEAGADPDSVTRHSRLSFATINKHLSSLQTCLGENLPVDRKGKTPLVAIRFSKTEVKANPAFRRSGLTDERLTAIFHGPAFTGFRDQPDCRIVPGNRLVLDAYYWVPLLSLFSGMCLEEALQLHPDDVATNDGIPSVSIGAIHNGQPALVKTEARVRTIPIHPTLVDLGFLEYATRMRKAGEKRLFPGLERGGPDRRFGHDFSQWFTFYRRGVGAYARGQDFHSLRHGVNRRLVKAKVPLPVVKETMGHSKGHDMSTAVYFGEVDLADMWDGLKTLSYPCLDVPLLLDRQRLARM
jgi:integrase